MSDARLTSPVRSRIRHLVSLVAVLALASPVGLPGRHPRSGADPVTLTMARNADMLTLIRRPRRTTPPSSWSCRCTIRLVKLNAASNTGVEPELATAWKVAPDGLSATFTLRQA